ncbi:MAG: hypothetical protein WCJ84_00865 [Candidatus Peregrinibacteria bacterium]
MKTIFIFTASWGNGHNTAAEGLKDREEEKGNRVKIFDMAAVSWGAKIFSKSWKFVSERPFLWKWIYRLGNNKTPNFLLRWLLRKSFLGFLKQTFSHHLPDAIFVTNSLFSEVIDEALTKKVPKTVFLTDYYEPHFFWTWGKSVRIVCLDHHAKEYLQKHIPKRNYHVSPFPLPRRIEKVGAYSPAETRVLREKWGVAPEVPVFTFFFHHFLFGNEIEIFWKHWETHRNKAEYLVLTGKNEKFFKNKMAPFPEIHILPWVDDMSEMYAITDFAVGKAGGALIGECQALKIPLEIYAALPGHEEANQIYWQSSSSLISSRLN